MGALRAFSPRAGWLVALSIAAVLAVGLAGFRGIAVARRSAREQAARDFREETTFRARSIETRLAAIRSDLAFVSTSSPIGRVHESAGAGDWRRAGAEGALLLFLRGHPEVMRVVVRSPRGEPLIQTDRRGGVPVLWLSSNPPAGEGAVTAGGSLPTSTIAFTGEKSAPGPTVEMEIAPIALLAEEESGGGGACALHDSAGRVLARHSRGGPPSPSADEVRASAGIAAEGWSVPGPWRLECAQPEALPGGRVDPVTAGYQATLILNVAAMGLAMVLGGLTVQQVRRRERLEAAAREEVRVRELERQLFHSERLATVGRLAAGIAHEINNPLEGMANWLSLARTELQQGRPESAAEHLGRVQEGLGRAARVVHQVLAHSDPAKAPRMVVDLNEILRDTEAFMQSRTGFAEVAFGLELADVPLPVRGSRVMLEQVAVNLILNACEAQPHGGEVRVRSRRAGTNAVAEIGDRGPGVAEADRERIFEPFFSTKDSTGLGLSICHSIVRQHDGELTVTGREGGGALFRVTLPVAEGA
jgi:signal transduction histidine kinase